jgi:hypothetical protein
MRERLFTMRMNDEESDRLETVARHYGLNGAGVLRMLVKREFDSIKLMPMGIPSKIAARARNKK